ncbi:MAG: hypothetical protein JW724_06500 [Candidatus Altiarchaeota archaeon]|nr:hypothetical protein [Candidatus Altiarchaeota archaeon]
MNRLKKQALIACMAVLAISILAGCVQEPQAKECSLSLCDCKCHPKGQTPEELEGRLCGINCPGEYGVTGCEYVDGKCTEKYITEEESKKIADGYVKNAPTYNFDGFDPAYVETTTLRCPFCWQFTYEFTSRHAGYGDRTDQVLAEVLTDHRITVTVIKGTVTGAIIDDKWDELEQKPLPSDETYCESDADCVPAQCCHPTSCVNAKYRPDCRDVMCTMSCEGPIDCGAGRCACEANECMVKANNGGI